MALAVDEKNRAPLRTRLARGDLQNDVDQLAEIQRGVQLLGGFNDAGKFFHRAATLRQRQHHGGKTREQIHLATDAILERPRAANLQNAHAKIVAPQCSRPNRGISAAVARQARFYSRGSRSGQGSRFGPDFRFAAVGAPKPCADDTGLAHRGVHYTSGNLIRREPALEEPQPIEQFGEKVVHFLTSRRFTHSVPGGKGPPRWGKPSRSAEG